MDNKPSDEVRSRNKLFNDSNLQQTSKLISVLRNIANSRNKTIAQVALNWLVTQLGVIPIPGAKNPRQAEQNSGATDWSLTKQELAKIEEVLKEIEIDYF